MSATPDAAAAWHYEDIAILPVAADGSKRPAIPWKQYQTVLPTNAEAAAWFGGEYPRYDGLGVICGAISGHLEMVEFEGRAVTDGLPARMAAAMADHGQSALWATIVGGYLERTPSGGLHVFYRVTGGVARPNTKLVRRPATAAELAGNPGAKIMVEMETRGEGGYSVVAPTPGTHHPSGRPWVVLLGSPATIPTITAEQRDTLYAIASTLDSMPAAAPGQGIPRPTTSTPGTTAGTRPGDDYNARAQWEDILIGWTRVRRIGAGYGWRRPGKDDPGISATTGTAADGVDRLYVFSTSTEFESETPYSKFAAYTLLGHSGDYKAAAKALAGRGFGSEPTIGGPPRQKRAPRTAPPPSEPAEPAPEPAPEPPPETSSPPADPPPEPEADAPPPPDPPDPPVDPPAPAGNDDEPRRNPRYSDNGNAMELIEHHGEHIRYCHDIGRWFVWIGTHWQKQPTSGGQVRELAKDIACRLPDTPKPAEKWKKSSLAAIGITNALTQAATDPRVTVTHAELDADPWALGTPIGTIDLHTGVIRPPDPRQLITRSTAVIPDPYADQSTWLAFLDTTFAKDTELIDYLQRLVGYSATGHIGPHVLPFAHGSGGNGKGVFLEAIAGVLGDYATTAPNAFLMARNYSPHETEIARLAGARMVLCSEVDETDKFDEAKVKQLTGGDTLTARFMRQDHFTFPPTHHLWLMGNYRPAVTSGGRGFWRRCRLIPFLHEVPPEQEIADLQGILVRDHGPALLAWIIRGAVDYATGGLREPDSVTRATADYAHDQDTVGRFVEEMCHRAPGQLIVKVLVRDLFAAYDRWCADTGELPVTAKRLTQELKQRFEVGSVQSNGKRFYTAISLLTDREEDGTPGTEHRDREWYR